MMNQADGISFSKSLDVVDADNTQDVKRDGEFSVDSRECRREASTCLNVHLP